MLERRSSRSGHPTVFRDGVPLCSTYDPVREASRFVRAAVGAETPGTILVLGEILGYLSAAAREAFPSSRVIAVYFAAELMEKERDAAHASWHPGSPAPLLGFLRSSLGELDLEGLKTVEWQASSRAFPGQALEALEATAQLTRELNGTITTTVRSGRLWLRNAMANFLHAPAPFASLPFAPGGPVLIAASGPSLEQAADTISRLRGRVSLWALPSAVDHLLHRGIEPDLVILTDPAYHSVCHLHGAAGRELTVAMPLTASRGIWRVSSRVALLGQGTRYERALLEALGGAAADVAPHGTVAGTAVELAIEAARGAPVLVAGLDVCYRDVLSHCRPNTFERFLLAGERRLEPFHSRACAAAFDAAPERIPGTTARTSLPLRTYAGWFASLPSARSTTLRRLSASEVPLAGVPPIAPDELDALCRSPPLPAPRPSQPRHVRALERRTAALRILRDWSGEMERWGESPAGIVPEIAMHLALRELIDARRRARAGDAGGARDAIDRAVGESRRFLRSLVELVEGSRDG